jgi:hypothetical protein
VRFLLCVQRGVTCQQRNQNHAPSKVERTGKGRKTFERDAGSEQSVVDTLRERLARFKELF